MYTYNPQWCYARVVSCVNNACTDRTWHTFLYFDKILVINICNSFYFTMPLGYNTLLHMVITHNVHQQALCYHASMLNVQLFTPQNNLVLLFESDIHSLFWYHHIYILYIYEIDVKQQLLWTPMQLPCVKLIMFLVIRPAAFITLLFL
jgi:hypothetical protein